MKEASGKLAYSTKPALVLLIKVSLNIPGQAGGTGQFEKY